jgi:hypothetical protein
MILATQKSPFEFRDKNRRSRSHIRNTDTNAYREDTHRKAPRRAILGRGFVPL